MIPKAMSFFVLDTGEGSGIIGAWASLSRVGCQGRVIHPKQEILYTEVTEQAQQAKTARGSKIFKNGIQTGLGIAEQHAGILFKE